MNFTKDMTVARALEAHPDARAVFAGFHLGGCAHCHIADYETIEQVCSGYGVPVETLLQTLNSLPNPLDK